jgi:hypothetical protein
VKEGIRAFFRTVLDELDNPRTPRVCLLVASMSEDVLAERELRQYVQEEMRAFAGSFADRLALAKQAGELPSGFDVETSAQVLTTYLQGLFRVIRVLQDRAQIERQVEALLSGLGL